MYNTLTVKTDILELGNLHLHIQIKKQKMKVKKSYALYMSFLAGLVVFVLLLLLPAVTNQFNQFWADMKK